MTQPYTASTLADRQAIVDLIYRYCRSVDRLDIPLGHSIWHDDAIADMTCLPESLADRNYYKPTERGFEKEIKRRLDGWVRLKQERRKR